MSWSNRVPLKIFGGLTNSHEHITANIERTLQRKYRPINEIAYKQQGAVAVVGSGPSLKETWKRLKSFKGEIIACNAAFQFLLERGITPRYMFCFDADPLILEFMTPRHDVTYLLASRCPQEAFDIVKDCTVYVWHAGGDRDIEELLQKYNRFEPMVLGGTAAVTRCMVLAEVLGFKDIHIFGADSSFINGETHIRKSTTDEKLIYIGSNKRAFATAPWMTQQVEDFKILAPILMRRCGVRLIVHGDGLLQHVARAMTRPGCKEYDEFPSGALRVTHRNQWWRRFGTSISYLYSTI